LSFGNDTHNDNNVHLEALTLSLQDSLSLPDSDDQVSREPVLTALLQQQQTQLQGCVVKVGVPWSTGFGPELESEPSFLRETPTSALSVSSRQK